MKHELVNLNVGSLPESKYFTIGQYNIELVQEYDELYFELPVVLYSNLKKKTTNKSTIFRKPIVTALAYCEKEPSAILTESKAPGIWDLCQILSYLSGHSVYTTNDYNRYHNNKYSEGIVISHEIPKAAQVAWENRSNFQTKDSLRPLWLYLNIQKTNESEIKLALECIALEIIQNLEFIDSIDDNNGMTEEEKELDNIKSDIRDLIDNCSISDDKKNALKGMFGNWSGITSKNKFQYLLEKYKLIPNKLSKDQVNRIKYINLLRNKIIHGGKSIPYKKSDNLDTMKATPINMSIFILPGIIKHYINIKFGLETYFCPSNTFQALMDYFYNGELFRIIK